MPALLYHGYEGEQKLNSMYDYFIQLLDTSYSMLRCLVDSNGEIDELFNKIRAISGDRALWNNN